MENKASIVSLADETRKLYSDYDLSLQKNEKIVNQYINDLIKDILQNKQIMISDKWFVEYSVLATTIDPIRTNENTGQLRCYSFINGDAAFKDKIEKFVSPIIAVLKDETEGKDNNWWFHNPETFLAPKCIDPYVSFTNNQDVNADIVDKISRRANIREQDLKEGITDDKYEQPDKDLPFYFSSMEYSRTFSDMLKYSKTLYGNALKNTDASQLDDILKEHYHDGVEKSRLYYDKFVANEGEEFCYLTFPIVASPARFRTPDIYKKTFGDNFLADRYQGIGHCFIYFNIKDLSNTKEQDFKEIVISLFLRINETLHHFAFNYTFNIGLYLQENAKKEAERSAKAAIMARNMSHNLGSHVMAYLKNDLRTVPSIFASSVLHHLVPNYIKNESVKIANEIELPFLVGLGNFIGYLQERQDYIATIASSYIPSFSPVNFKDAIFDELNPDMRFERHHSNDNENHNRPQNILLSYIAKSEKLSRMKSCGMDNHDILMGFKCEKGYFGLTKESNNSTNESLESMRTINFALPGGIVGRQALFSIIENIIRNAAKHNNVEGNLALIFEILDGNAFVSTSDVYIKSIASEFIRKQYHNSTDISDLLILSITDNQVCKDSTIRKLREALTQKYTGGKALLNKGIKEIKISATWLRGADDDGLFAPCSIDESSEFVLNQRAPIVAVEKSSDNHLRYLICLKKTYEVALVYDTKTEKSQMEAFRNAFDLKEGAYMVLSESDIIHSDTCFEYIVAENEDVFDRIRPFVSNRCICKSQIEAKSNITAEMIYQTFTGFKDNLPTIFIEDTKTQDDKILYKQHIERIASFDAAKGRGAQYIYRSHHFGEKEFVAYWNDKAETTDKDNIIVFANKQVAICVDSITGDNSSDRLVRRETLDKKWYYGHLHALDSDVAVFDERLFQIIHGIDESMIIEGSYLASELLQNINIPQWPQKLDGQAIRELAYSIGVKELDDITTFKRLYDDCVDSEINSHARSCMKNFVSRFRFRLKDKIEGHSFLSAAYREKRVEVYTIIPTSAEECLIVGCSDYMYTKVDKDNPHFCFPFRTIARIYKENGEYKCSSMKKCKYLTIHQGLIDKMYSEFKISEDDSNEKVKLLCALYAELLGGGVNTDEFLPGVTIHSGRGHITSKDMPLNLPFIQYSAIEHAVLDSKYSLIELLDFAKYN